MRNEDDKNKTGDATKRHFKGLESTFGHSVLLFSLGSDPNVLQADSSAVESHIYTFYTRGNNNNTKDINIHKIITNNPEMKYMKINKAEEQI